MIQIDESFNYGKWNGPIVTNSTTSRQLRRRQQQQNVIWIIKYSCIERALRALVCNEKKESGLQNDIQEE